ncbi:hypothetical protein GHT06_018468 [Daphnia sinensis]|uniref:Uncharacterized protein n=1 Tax=Daphnia sinensis TaxID=1820382 RepID=A0AAD5PQ59_9CRUS|nr:hypothetical protein GHT06_018468 [Daphnia sinensis]
MLNGRLQITQCRQTSFLMFRHTVVYFGETMHGIPPPRVSLLSFFFHKLLHHP